jgi:hypothetical protein
MWPSGTTAVGLDDALRSTKEKNCRCVLHGEGPFRWLVVAVSPSRRYLLTQQRQEKLAEGHGRACWDRRLHRPLLVLEKFFCRGSRFRIRPQRFNFLQSVSSSAHYSTTPTRWLEMDIKLLVCISFFSRWFVALNTLNVHTLRLHIMLSNQNIHVLMFSCRSLNPVTDASSCKY